MNNGTEVIEIYNNVCIYCNEVESHKHMCGGGAVYSGKSKWHTRSNPVMI